MSARMNITGLKELQAQLTALGAIAGRKVLQAAARKAMKPVLEDARAHVPVRTGLLQKSLRIAAVRPKSGNIVVSVGLTVARRLKEELPEEAGDLAGEKITVEGARWRWHFVELGVPSRGIAAHPFLRPAMESKKGEVVAIFKEELAKGIKRAIRRREKAAALAAGDA